MREFLCKGKRKKNGEWVTGHYQRRIHILDKIEHLIYHYESYEDWEYAEIIPETCCQYSELLDKAHNGIWEKRIGAIVLELSNMVCMEKSLDGISNGFPLRQMVFVRISPIG